MFRSRVQTAVRVYVHDTICQKILIDSLPKSGQIPSQPSGTVLTVNSSGVLMLPGNVQSYSIYSMTGALLQQQKSVESTLNVSRFKPGVYVIRLILNNGNTVNLRFVR